MPSDIWSEDQIRRLRDEHDLPFVRADQSGIVREINVSFSTVYGWTENDLIGQSLGLILPPSFRDSHHAGFARFQLTESSKVVGHPLTLATICRDGSEVQSEHYIVAEKHNDGTWSFAATLRPLEGSHASGTTNA